MRKLTLIGIAAIAGTFVLAPAAQAERVCKERCEGGTCVQKCVERSDTRVIRDRDVIVRERAHRPRSGVELHVPGVSVDIGR